MPLDENEAAEIVDISLARMRKLLGSGALKCRKTPKGTCTIEYKDLEDYLYRSIEEKGIRVGKAKKNEIRKYELNALPADEDDRGPLLYLVKEREVLGFDYDTHGPFMNEITRKQDLRMLSALETMKVIGRIEELTRQSHGPTLLLCAEREPVEKRHLRILKDKLSGMGCDVRMVKNSTYRQAAQEWMNERQGK